MATQNPVESYGTFPLPEAQLDRFFMRLSLGYMTREQEMEVVSRPSTADILNSLEPVVSPEVIQEMKELYTKVRVQKDVLGYMMDIVEKRGMEIDTHRLPEMLGIPVIPGHGCVPGTGFCDPGGCEGRSALGPQPQDHLQGRRKL